MVLDSLLAAGPWVYVAAFGAGLLWLVASPWRRRVPVVGVLLAAAGAGGLLHHNAYYRVGTDHLVHQVGAGRYPVTRVRGTVATTPRVAPKATGLFAPWMFSPDRTSFLLDADAVEGPVGFVPVSGRVRVTIKEAVMDLAAGERVEIFGRLYRPTSPDNPGSFDWSRWQRRHGVLVGMSCNYREGVTKLKSDVGASRPAWPGGLEALRLRARGLLLDDMLSIGAPESTLLETMILAQRSSLNPSIRQAFVRTGASHYLAVSGFHVGMLGLFVYAAGRAIGLTRRWSAVAVVVATLCYAVMAEPRPPIFRATVLTMAVCASLVLRRGRSYFNWLALSALCYLIWRPMDLFEVGFQMSYGCVIGILLLAPALRDLILRVVARRPWSFTTDLVKELSEQRDRQNERRRLWVKWLIFPVAVALAAWLSSLPLLVLNFRQFSPWGWLNTLLMFPPVAVVMFLGFAQLLVGALSPLLSGLLTPMVQLSAGVLLWWVGVLGKAPGVTVFTSAPPLAWVVLYDAGLLAWAAVYRGVLGRRWAIAVTAVWALTTAIWLAPPRASGSLTMTVLSVGRGTSIVIELPDGGTVLYDAGCSGSYDPGATAIVPFLADRGIRRLETVIISHPNLDHFGGFPTVADHVRIGSVMLNPQFERLSPPDQPSSVLIEELRRRKLAVETMDASVSGFEIGGARFDVLWPPRELPFEPTANESSIVLRVAHAGRSILLAGDIEEHAQRCLLESGVDLRADVLVLPHHGSTRRNTRAFVEAVSPGYVVRSTFERNETSLARLRSAIGERPLFNTADDGAIRVVLGGRGIEIAGFTSGSRGARSRP